VLSYPAHATVEYLLQVTPKFMSPDLWPSNIYHLNPVDCKIWDVL